MIQKTFKEAAGPYNAALIENGQNYILKYTPNHTRQENSRAKPITEEQNVAQPNHNYCMTKKKKRKKHKSKKNNMV